MKTNKLIGVNTYCAHSHNINKGKYVYTSNMYKKLAISINGEFFCAEQKDCCMYENNLKT